MKCKLLPYIREDIFGLSPENCQFFGWEIKKLNIEKQWKYSTGKGVKIAVIDTGCDLNHPDIKDNLLQGYNFVEDNEDPTDRNGHGTHVTGTIAACNNGMGMVGVAPDAKIMPVKALGDDGSGNLNDIVRAISWSIDNGADIISMSLGSEGPNEKLEKVIQYAASKNIILFCAAGNSGESVDIMYPAKYDHTIAIGAIDSNFERTSFTCSGETLDFLCPGMDIISAVPGGGYASMSGTSMSNPFAVGYAALLLSYARSLGGSKGVKLGQSLRTTDDYINIFSKSVMHLSNNKYSNNKKYEGHGILLPDIKKVT
jgi:subtilisin family serine protease